MTTIAFIGLGNMGGPMAANLLKAGHDVIGVDLSDAAKARHREAGGRLGDSPQAAAGEADIAITMLPAGQHVRGVCLGEDGVLAALQPGGLLIDCSTIDIDTARAVGEAAAAAGRLMIDAPVSGGVGGATAGTLTFMVGGLEAAVTAARPALEAMGRNIFHAGPTGAGQAAKMCNNMMLAIQMISVAEGFRLAEKLGLPAQSLYEIGRTATSRCWSLDSYCPVPGMVEAAPVNRDFEGGFATELMLKDLGLAMDAANKAGAATPLGAEATQLYRLWAAQGMGRKDFSSIIQLLGGAGL